VLTQDRLHELFEYDPASGWLTRRCNLPGGAKAGDRAGTGSGKYRRVHVDGKRYYEHVIAWVYMTGKFPTLGIDHRNLNKQDNSWDNLREATPQQNGWNGVVRKHSSTGLRGVHMRGPAKFVALIQNNELKREYLGTFPTAGEASAAYEARAKELRGEFYRPDCS
jgi:hypothetical protein